MCKIAHKYSYGHVLFNLWYKFCNSSTMKVKKSCCNYRMEKLLTDNCKLQKVLFNSKKNHKKLINPAIL